MKHTETSERQMFYKTSFQPKDTNWHSVFCPFYAYEEKLTFTNEMFCIKVLFILDYCFFLNKEQKKEMFHANDFFQTLTAACSNL